MDSPQHKFFVSDDGKDKLTLSKAELQAGIDSGKHTDETLAWTNGMSGWLRLSDPQWDKHGVRVQPKPSALPPSVPEAEQNNVTDTSETDTVLPNSTPQTKQNQSKTVPKHPAKSGVSKVLIGVLCIGLLVVFSAGGGLLYWFLDSEPDSDNPDSVKEIIAKAKDEDKLQERDKEKDELVFAPKEPKPLTGKSEETYDNETKPLEQHKNGESKGLTASDSQEIKDLAERGDKNAQYQLGLMFLKGEKLPQDNIQATKWLTKSAKQGYDKAHNLLARTKEEERDRQEAITLKVKSLIEKRDGFVTSNKLEMIWVKPGTFARGSLESEDGRDEWFEIQHQVKLSKGFYLGKHEVTQAQWEHVMKTNPSYFKGADHPVERVSWEDAMEFCKKLTDIERKAGRVPDDMSYQLPTEGQWEYACRAGTTTAYPWGNTIEIKNARYDREFAEGTTSVGKYPANPWGFHDMHGNVWEWCADWYAEYPHHNSYPGGAVPNPSGPAIGVNRVKRGGSFGTDAIGLRSANRGEAVRPSDVGTGFRVALQANK